MIFTGIRETENMVIVDGYSNRKSVKTAIRDLGKYIRDNINVNEGQGIMDYPAECRVSVEDRKAGCFFLEVEEVPCASNWNEETEEMEYDEANYYVVCRFAK